MRNRIAFFASFFFLACIAWAQQPSSNSQSNSQSMPGMGMPAHDMSNMKDMPMNGDSDKDSDAGMHAMEGHMDMGPHMKMTALRPARPGDAERAQKVVEASRKASEKYMDYHVALAEGFKIFCRIFRRRCITSPTINMGAKPLSRSIPSIPLLYSMKNMGTITS